MDYEYTQCLNPIIATFGSNDHNLKHVYSTNFKSSNIKIIGNLKHLSKVKGDSYLIRLLSQDNVIKLPCRQCLNCQYKRSKEWSTRLCLERREYGDDVWFVTLTYDDDHNEKSLSISHVQNFMKSLRSKFPKQRIRFFCSGEYGAHTFRPHYHIIIYGLNLKNSDFEFLYSQNSNNYFKCFPIEECWNKGIVVVTNFSDFTSFYVAQYTTKKMYKKDNSFYFFDKNNLQLKPEFATMSRRPGIAFNYYNTHKDEIYQSDGFNFHIDYKTVHVKPFQFFDRLYDVENPDYMKFIKENRKSFSREYEFFTHHDFNVPIYQWLSNCDRQLYAKSQLRSNFNKEV